MILSEEVVFGTKGIQCDKRRAFINDKLKPNVSNSPASDSVT